MDPIGKIPILLLEDCICTQLDVPTTVLMTKKLQNGWCHCVVSGLITSMAIECLSYINTLFLEMDDKSAFKGTSHYVTIISVIFQSQ